MLQAEKPRKQHNLRKRTGEEFWGLKDVSFLPQTHLIMCVGWVAKLSWTSLSSIRKQLDLTVLNDLGRFRISWFLGNVSITWHLLYVEYKKKWYIWTYWQNRKKLTDLENEVMVAQGKGWEKGIVRELGWTWTHCYIENGSPTRTYCTAQWMLLNVMCSLDGRGVWGRMEICICMAESLSLFTWN